MIEQHESTPDWAVRLQSDLTALQSDVSVLKSDMVLLKKLAGRWGVLLVTVTLTLKTLGVETPELGSILEILKGLL